MILIDGEQKTPKQVCTMFGLPLDKIAKESIFDLNENLKGFDLGMREKKYPRGQMFPAVFMAETKDGISLEIRYATNITKRRSGDSVIEVFTPENVMYEGQEHIPQALDEAIYLYLHFKHEYSPFRGQSTQPWVYSFRDKEAIASGHKNRTNLLIEALNHAKNITDEELIILSKGITDIKGNHIQDVDNKEPYELRSELEYFAESSPVDFLNKTNNLLTAFTGRLIDAIDKGIFIEDNKFGSKQWKWAKGKRRGEDIVLIDNINIDSKQYFINYIKENIDKYMNDVEQAHLSINSDLIAEKFLKEKKALDSVRNEAIEPEPKETVYTAFPSTFQECKDFLAERKGEGKNPSNVETSGLKKAIESGEVDATNIEDYAYNLYNM